MLDGMSAHFSTSGHGSNSSRTSLKNPFDRQLLGEFYPSYVAQISFLNKNITPVLDKSLREK